MYFLSGRMKHLIYHTGTGLSEDTCRQIHWAPVGRAVCTRYKRVSDLLLLEIKKGQKCKTLKEKKAVQV